MIDPHEFLRRQPSSQFPPWLANDLGLDPSTIDITIRRPTTWDRVRRFVRMSRRRHADALAQPSPIVGRRPPDPLADNESAAA
jgi:hypothetical protein